MYYANINYPFEMFTSVMSTLDSRRSYELSLTPEGYELVEKQEHKESRLKKEIESLKSQVEYHSKQGAVAAENL